MFVEVPKRREFSRDGAPIEAVLRKLFQKSANVIALRLCQAATLAPEESIELAEVTLVGGDGEWSEALLNLQVRDESDNDLVFKRGNRHPEIVPVIGRCEQSPT